ncbi:hypothetical protein QQS21_005152 [Conoideocrella luteorostrata]|uniref:tyrosinase n=1 Tax=Conoideocrella luteorostrata TaxID=1105319 RepID=A0AAJ0G150_9HYPO|nr:hypothetical protein QQS21_005152 [Conoideocrella luteorostrata]
MFYRIRKAALLSLLPSFLFCLVTSQSYDFGFDTSRLTRRDDAKTPIVVRRLPTPVNGTLPVRLEIRQMKQNSYKWDLFILAMSMFQYANQSDPLSWYQIAGIHGVPFTTWNGVEPLPGTSQSGYCTHGSVLFPMWHRPYLALFEQQLYKMANAIALMFTNTTQRQLYQQAAADFRIPYWDWSLAAPVGETHLPDVFWSPVMLQFGPNGVQNIKNPLYSYQFHPLDTEALIWNPLKQWDETKRAPNTTISLTAPPSVNEEVSDALLSKLPEIQQRLYILFSNYHDFNSFGNKAWAATQGMSRLDSVESIHDVVHIYGGSKGHLTYVPLSSFDPLFLFHHTMTDRLVDMWQILNPDAWITPMVAGETSYTSLKGTIQSSVSPLTPFFASEDGIFWNSDTARNTAAFGYGYADTMASPEAGPDIRKELIRKINIWYGSSSPLGLMATASSSGSGKQAEQGNDMFSFSPNIRYEAKNPSASRIVQQNEYTEWVANVRVNVEALDGSFFVHFFLGDPPTDETSWNSAPNLVGSVAVFAMNRMTGSQSKISGTVPLTSAIMKMVAAGKIEGLSPPVVQPFLANYLHFTVQSSNNSRVDPRTVEGLFICVDSSNVQVPKKQSELPWWGTPVQRLKLWG